MCAQAFQTCFNGGFMKMGVDDGFGNGFSKWHYEFASKISDEMAWERIP